MTSVAASYISPEPQESRTPEQILLRLPDLPKPDVELVCKLRFLLAASAFFSPFMLLAEMTAPACNFVFTPFQSEHPSAQNIWLIYKNGARFFTYFWSNVHAPA